jgi:cytoskeleton protein RodZ
VGNLDAVQSEQLRAIGTYLSQIRQEQSRSLEDIAAKTYIPLRLLRAIEAGQEQPLPEPVFVQGFIRRYGDTLGLDGMDLAQRFPLNTPPVNRELVAKDAVGSPYAVAQTEVLESPRASRIESSEFSHRSPRRSYIPYVAAVGLLAIGGLVYALTKSHAPQQSSESSDRSTSTLPKQDVSTSPSVSAKSPSPASTPFSVTAKSPSPVASTPSLASPIESTPGVAVAPSPVSNAPVAVNVSLTDRSWLQVSVDGRVQFEGTLPKGTQRSWSGKDRITVVAGNAGAVSVASNGGAAKTMGALGSVEQITATAKKPQSSSSNSLPN